MPENHNVNVDDAAPARCAAGVPRLVLAEEPIASAWNLQGDPTRVTLVEEARQIFDIALPVTPNTTTRRAGLTALWLGPKSWLLLAAGASPIPDFPGKRDALNRTSGALFDLSASRIAWTVSGRHAASVLAKRCPLDLHPRAFPAGTCAQSLLGHVNAIIYKPDASESFTVMVARSFAPGVWQELRLSAAQYGFGVGSPTSLRS